MPKTPKFGRHKESNKLKLVVQASTRRIPSLSTKLEDSLTKLLTTRKDRRAVCPQCRVSNISTSYSSNGPPSRIFCSGVRSPSPGGTAVAGFVRRRPHGSLKIQASDHSPPNDTDYTDIGRIRVVCATDFNSGPARDSFSQRSICGFR